MMFLSQNKLYFWWLKTTSELVMCISWRYKRAEVIQSYRWNVGRVLPKEIQDKLNFSEQEYFKNHCAVIDTYVKDLELDLTVVNVFSLSFPFKHIENGH